LTLSGLQTDKTHVQVVARFRAVVYACQFAPEAFARRVQARGQELVCVTGRLMSPDRGFEQATSFTSVNSTQDFAHSRKQLKTYLFMKY